MAQVMNKTDFCDCLEVLRRYSTWESTMYNSGLDFGTTPVSELAEKLHSAMCGFNFDWAYDTKLSVDWIIEWNFNFDNCKTQVRHNKEWILDTAESLYDFLVFMNEHGWND